MYITRNLRRFVILLALGFSQSAIAQGVNEASIIRGIDTGSLIAAEQDAETVRNTGESSTSPSATNSLTDFLQRFLISTASEEIGQQGEESLVFEWSKPLAPAGFAKSHDYKVGIALVTPGVFEELKSVSSVEQLSELESGLDFSDSATFSFEYSLTTKRLGRNPQSRNNIVLLSKLAENAVLVSGDKLNRERGDDTEPWDEEQQRICTMLFDSIGSDAEDVCENPSAAKEQFPHVAEMIDRLIEIDRIKKDENALRLQRYDEALQKMNFNQFLGLVRNQPQLIVTGSYRALDERAGQDEWSMKVTYEMGFSNLNLLRQSCRDEWGYLDAKFETNATRQHEQQRAEFFDCASRYLTENQRSLKDSDRLAFSLEYTRKSDYSFSSEDPMLSLDLDSSNSILAELVYGRNLISKSDGGAKLRLDVGAKYEDVSDDEMRQDRATGSITLSRELGNDLFLNAGLVWANKPEFRAEANRDLTANIGINYKIGRSK